MLLDAAPPTTKMGRLIPLFLESVSRRESKVFPPWDPIPRAESPTLPPPSKVEVTKVRGRQGPLTKLTIVPYTAAEWVKVMEEVKAFYYKKQYRQCSVRCKQILDTIRDPYRVHPLYSIYLCFFAASSLELQARTLHSNSSLRHPLFNESLTYYKKAQSHMEFATFASNPDIIQASTNKHQHNSSISSSIRSSVDSIFSELSTSSVASSILDSPSSNSSPLSALKRIDSTTKDSNLVLRPAPLRTKKKKVSFSLTAEPGLEDSQDGGMTAEDLLSRFPFPPTHDSLSPAIVPPHFNALALDNPPRSPSPPSPSLQTPINTTVPRSASIASHYSLPNTAAHSSSRKAESVMRYRKHLDSLKDQLEYHTTSLHAQIHTLTTIRRARRSNGSDLFATQPPYNRSGSQSTTPSSSPTSTPGHSPSNSISSTSGTITPKGPIAASLNNEATPTIFTPSQTVALGLTSEMLQSTPVSIKSRIQRLKKGNWIRPRFNPDRYQALCDMALQEMQEEGWRTSVR